MNIFQRISKLMSAEINAVLDKAEDPEVMVKQIIRDMEESIIDLRRETVKAIAQQKTAEKKLALEKGAIGELEARAGKALEMNDEALARKILTRKLDVEKIVKGHQERLQNAKGLAEQLKADLAKMEDKVQAARRKKEELIRRKRAAEAKQRTNNALQKGRDMMSALSSSVENINAKGEALESYEDKIRMLEAELEAEEELEGLTYKKEAELEKMVKDKKVEDELKKLKEKVAKKMK